MPSTARPLNSRTSCQKASRRWPWQRNSSLNGLWPSTAQQWRSCVARWHRAMPPNHPCLRPVESSKMRVLVVEVISTPAYAGCQLPATRFVAWMSQMDRSPFRGTPAPQGSLDEHQCRCLQGLDALVTARGDVLERPLARMNSSFRTVSVRHKIQPL